MMSVDLSAEVSAPLVARSFRSCLASVLEIPVGEVPPSAGDLPECLARWRSWLAGIGFGLAPVASAAGFQWPGYWIAVLDDTTGPRGRVAVLMFGTPPGVVLSPADPALLGEAASDLPVVAGYVVAAFDPVWLPDPTPVEGAGRVEVIAVAHRAEAPMRRVPTARAVPGRGLEGDRYFVGAGTFTPRKRPGTGYDLTLVEAEVLDELASANGTRLEYADARRNIVTRGVDLNSLVGQRFKIGEVECIGRRLCEPCVHLERLTSPGVLRGLIHKGGLRADILTEGEITLGAAIEPLES